MTYIADHDEAPASSLSAVDFIEDAFRSLNLTRVEAQNVVRVLVEVINRATSPTPTSPPSSSSHSTTSVDSAGALSVTSCPTCSFHGNSLVGGSPCSTATSTMAVSIAAASTVRTPVVAPAAVPITSPVAPALAATAVATVGAPAIINPVVSPAPIVNAAVAPPVAATVTGTTPSVAAPLYAAVPPNAPSNAVLPPAHLIVAPHGYHVPAANTDGPFYVVARGRNIGIFSGWETVSPLVTGVSHAVYSRVASIAEGHARINAANNAAFAVYLT
ncbi:uncharacterized protein LACBIDRAFT_333469 [Laccaria bicolor S238N-H82]|uniref:Predicted protein n=1 Tax=Laccaria bicolor (strain S238N-H82 / ATCC MYA-4686) TaxID=486041 RepID=B0DW05_LACBS|nr:uncharacterized protein LACBIDRAFT_333469 [Laccaria bicolor S238N-H82]EDR01227.1 predicted protein [Laccaria bicolor S238N-H82]|eukprot:XP_001888103.1 predicted protein [Laccaria bicolor S238N-H82]